MKYFLVAIGTRGDVQPFVALGKALKAAGQDVTIGTAPMFEELVKTHGLTFAPVRVDARLTFDQDISEIGANPVKIMRWLIRHYRQQSDILAKDLLAAVTDVDAIVYHSLAFLAFNFAESMKIPAIAGALYPFTPTREFCSPSAVVPPGVPFRGLANWLGYRLSSIALLMLTYGSTNEVRTKMLGLPRVSRRSYWLLDMSGEPVVYGYSPALLPKPADWDDHKTVTGYWFLDAEEEWRPPQDLLAFLEAGAPPVYIGFGSMIDREADVVTQIVVDAVALSGQRAVLLGGWSELGSGDLPDTICRIDYAPHAWLFPRMAAVVHHGGAGTTAAGLRAGVPQVIVPFFADQPWWGQIVYERGVAPAPVPRKSLTAEKLAQAIRLAVTDEGIRASAALLGEQVSAENGAAEAARQIIRITQEKRAAGLT